MARDEVRELRELVMKLGHALELTKADSAKDGFVYGKQSVCMDALRAYWDYCECSRRK